MSITQFSGRLYPDKTFSLGAVPRKKKTAQDKRYERAVHQQEEVDYGALSDWLIGKNSIEGKFCAISEAPLFIESPKSSRKSRGSYGKHGITGYGKKFVRNSALLLERKFSKERLGFVTCTLPSYPEELQHRINGVWGEIVRRFYQKLKRQLEKISEPFIYVGVTEIQERRFKNTGIPVPHLHFVYLCRGVVDKRYWLYVCQIHRAWNEAVREGIRFAGYPLGDFACMQTGSVHAKCVRKSVAAYLGKYVSKGCKVLKAMQDSGWVEFPKQWWNADMETKKMFMSALIILKNDVCKALFYGFEHYLHDGLLVNAYIVHVNLNGIERDIGLSGRMSDEMYKCFLS